MTHSLAGLNEPTEAAAYADMMRAAPPELGMRVDQIGSATALICPKTPAVLFNRVMGLGVTEPATPRAVDALVELYRAAGVAEFAVQIAPVPQANEIRGWLETRGVKLADNWAKVYRPASADVQVETDLRIEEIGPDHASAFARLAIGVFGLPAELEPWLSSIAGRPNWHLYMAFDGATPAATGGLFINGDVGWLGIAATLPRFRNRGGQGAIMARRIRDAHRLGCVWVITETGEDTPAEPNPSYRNMLRTGFKLAYLRRNYLGHA